MFKYNSKEHKQVIELANKTVDGANLSAGNQQRFTDILSKALYANKEYMALSTEDILVSGLGDGFSALFEAVMTVKEGNAVSGAYLFNLLKKYRVFAPNMTLDENMKSFDRLSDNLVSGDEKKLKSFKDTVSNIKEAVRPYLLNWSSKNMLSRQIEIRELKTFVDNRTSKKR